MTKQRRLPPRIAFTATGAAALLLLTGNIPLQGIAHALTISQQEIPPPPPPPDPPVVPPPVDPNATPAEPPAQEQPSDLMTTASADGRISVLVKALQAADMGTLLGDKSGGPYTVFAPVNTAFTRLPNGKLDSLLKPENKAELSNLLKSHIVSGRLTRADLLKMKEGDELTTLAGTKLKIGPLVRRTPSISGASIVSADALASNGVLHLISAVLIPAEGTPPAPLPVPPNNDPPHPGPPPE